MLSPDPWSQPLMTFTSVDDSDDANRRQESDQPVFVVYPLSLFFKKKDDANPDYYVSVGVIATD